MSKRYPPEIERLHNALRGLRGVVADSVSTGMESISGLPQEMLSLPDLAHLPHAALRRTRGGLKNEALVQCEFSLSRDEAGWRRSSSSPGSSATRPAAASSCRSGPSHFRRSSGRRCNSGGRCGSTWTCSAPTQAKTCLPSSSA